MTRIHPAWLAREQRRWLRPDAHRWWRPDHVRFDKPNGFERKYSPDQPRVPAGSPDGGQWTGGGPSGSLGLGDETDLLFEETIHFAQLDGLLDDAGQPYYQRGGHHEMPRGVYRNWALSDETRRVFDRATTGSVPSSMLRTTPDGVPYGNFWTGPSGAHGQYNRAVEQLSERFIERNGISPQQMTPDHARALLKEIRETDDPRIRNFNNAMRLLRRIIPLRSGRGSE
jgi:hypothetical protein